MKTSDLNTLLAAFLNRLQERQDTMQQAFYENSTIVNELRAMILLDLLIVVRDTYNDIISR